MLKLGCNPPGDEMQPILFKTKKEVQVRSLLPGKVKERRLLPGKIEDSRLLRRIHSAFRGHLFHKLFRRLSERSHVQDKVTIRPKANETRGEASREEKESPAEGVQEKGEEDRQGVQEERKAATQEGEGPSEANQTSGETTGQREEGNEERKEEV